MWILLWFLPVCHLLDWVILSWYIIWVYHWVTFTCWYRCTIGTSSGIKPSWSCLYASLYDNLKSILASFQFLGIFTIVDHPLLLLWCIYWQCNHYVWSPPLMFMELKDTLFQMSLWIFMMSSRLDSPWIFGRVGIEN